jgi:glucose/arabinose dehydrogenase
LNILKKRLLLPVFLLGCTSFAQTIALETFATDIIKPVEIINAGTNKIYVAGQNGVISIVNVDGTVDPMPYLNISATINFQGELGLLGIAFHPDYITNGYCYVNYINAEGNTVIARYTRSASNPEIADPDSAFVVLNITQMYGYHQGGCLRFGPDGYLYIASGDGGESEMGQNINTLLGKILRIDVNNGTTYSIPETNPFATTDGADEVWAIGLRNPWKFSFDAEGNIWIADVGQNNVEEIDKANVTQAGVNYGWRCYEGAALYNDSLNCPQSSALTFPYAEYTHSGDGGCSVTGGYVYNGTLYPGMQGKYFFADYCSNKIGWVDSEEPGPITWSAAFTGNFTTIGEDVNGELYVGGGSNGIIYKITDATAGVSKFAAEGITMYPNPANNEVLINIKNQGAPAEVALFDLSGKRLIQQSVNTDTNRIDTSSLHAGLYLLEVTTSGRKMQQKLIIN